MALYNSAPYLFVSQPLIYKEALRLYIFSIRSRPFWAFLYKQAEPIYIGRMAMYRRRG